MLKLVIQDDSHNEIDLGYDNQECDVEENQTCQKI